MGKKAKRLICGFLTYTAVQISKNRTAGKLKPGGCLERGWIIANHKVVSFNAAFISSVMNLPETVEGKLATLRFMFVSVETIVSAVIVYLSWHIGIAIHEMGHYLTAAKLTALNKDSQESAEIMHGKGLLSKTIWYVRMFVTIRGANLRE